MIAIICAAGNSKRMGTLTKDLPKPLLPILGSVSIIENLVSSLCVKPVDKILVIIGHLGEQIIRRLGTSYNGVVIEYIENAKFLNTNNMYSLLLTKHKIDSDIIFVSGDVYLNNSTCKDFIQKGPENSILVEPHYGSFLDDDPVKVTIENGLIVGIDKKLSPTETNGIAVGAYKMSKSVMKKYLKLADEYIKQGYYNHGYIEPIKNMLNKTDFLPHSTQGSIWFDIDTVNEYESVKRFLKEL